jgi:hypothetical protein
MKLILYGKPGCHLCEGLQEKLEQILKTRHDISLEVRDITSREDWWQNYQYEIPVLCLQVGDREEAIPRPSPRATAGQLERSLQKYWSSND